MKSAVVLALLLVVSCDLGAGNATKEFKPLDASLLGSVERDQEPAVYYERDADVPGTGVRIVAHDDVVTAMAFVDATTLATGSWGDRRVCLWDTADGTLLSEAENEHRVSALAALPDGSGVLTVDAYGYLVLWPIEGTDLDAPEILNATEGENELDEISDRLADGRLASWENNLNYYFVQFIKFFG